MRPALVLLLAAPALMEAAQLQIDHTTVCGADLKHMQAALTAIGIPSEYGGPHSNHATEMALTSFPDGSYLEQIALQPKGDPKAIDAHEWSKQMKGNSGPCAWAVRPADMAAEVKRLPGAHSSDCAGARGTGSSGWDQAGLGDVSSGPDGARDFLPFPNP